MRVDGAALCGAGGARRCRQGAHRGGLQPRGGGPSAQHAAPPRRRPWPSARAGGAARRGGTSGGEGQQRADGAARRGRLRPAQSGRLPAGPRQLAEHSGRTAVRRDDRRGGGEGGVRGGGRAAAPGQATTRLRRRSACTSQPRRLGGSRRRGSASKWAQPSCPPPHRRRTSCRSKCTWQRLAAIRRRRWRGSLAVGSSTRGGATTARMGWLKRGISCRRASTSRRRSSAKSTLPATPAARGCAARPRSLGSSSSPCWWRRSAAIPTRPGRTPCCRSRSTSHQPSSCAHRLGASPRHPANMTRASALWRKWRPGKTAGTPGRAAPTGG